MSEHDAGTDATVIELARHWASTETAPALMHPNNVKHILGMYDRQTAEIERLKERILALDAGNAEIFNREQRLKAELARLTPTGQACRHNARWHQPAGGTGFVCSDCNASIPADMATMMATRVITGEPRPLSCEEREADAIATIAAAGVPTTYGLLHAVHGLLERCTPSGQVAEDEAALGEGLKTEPHPSRCGTQQFTERPCDCAVAERRAALSRLAAKAQGYEAAVADNAALWRLAELLAPAMAVLSRAPEVSPELRAELAEAERLFLACGRHPGAAILDTLKQKEEQVKALGEAATKAAAELRHTYGHHEQGYRLDPALISRAIRILEEATKP